MMTPSDRDQLKNIVDEVRLSRVFSDLDDLDERLNAFSEAYARKAAGIPTAFPHTVAIGDILATYRDNPHRVKVLLQATAFRCSPEMLAMMWMVDLGAVIMTLDIHYSSRTECSLHVRVSIGHPRNEVSFESKEVWDVAVLRFAGISRVDNAPLLEGFYAMRLPSESKSLVD